MLGATSGWPLHLNLSALRASEFCNCTASCAKPLVTPTALSSILQVKPFAQLPCCLKYIVGAHMLDTHNKAMHVQRAHHKPHHSAFSWCNCGTCTVTNCHRLAHSTPAASCRCRCSWVGATYLPGQLRRTIWLTSPIMRCDRCLHVHGRWCQCHLVAYIHVQVAWKHTLASHAVIMQGR